VKRTSPEVNCPDEKQSTVAVECFSDLLKVLSEDVLNNRNQGIQHDQNNVQNKHPLHIGHFIGSLR